MSDKKIISVISKIYFTIISIFSFIFLSLVVIFITLQHGLFIEDFSLPNLTIKNIYIKWDEQLNISIDEITIEKGQTSDKTTDLQEINRYLKLTSRFFLLTNSVVIEKLHYGDTVITLTHNRTEQGLLLADSPDFHLNLHFKFYKKFLIFNVEKSTFLQKRLQLDGHLILDTQEKKIFSKLNLLLNNDFNATLYGIADNKRFDYTLKSHKKIKDIHKILALFHLPKAIRYWAMDAIDTSSVTIHRAKGFVQYNDLKSAYRHLDLFATLEKLNYTYNQKLDAIHTKTTDLKMLYGVLYIYPRKAYSYGMYLDKSWLKIDFTQPQELLTLHLLFNGMLNKDMLHILNTYHIKLPFLQHTGKVKTDLTIKVTLRDIDIDAKGTFFTKKANFDYLGLNIDIADTLIQLDNYDVFIPKMKAAYKKMAAARVKVNYNAKNAKGKINFFVNKIKLNEKEYLKTGKKPLHVLYTIDPKGDTVHVAKSLWSLYNEDVTLQSLTMPFDLNSLKLTIPTTYFTVGKIADGFVTGTADIKKSNTNIAVDLLHFQYQAIKLAQSNAELTLHYGKKLSLNAKDDLFLTVNGSRYTIKNFALLLDKNTILLQKSHLKIGQYIKTDISANYNLTNQKAKIHLKNFVLVNPKSKKILYHKDKATLFFSFKPKKMFINAPELAANFIMESDKWVLNLDSVSVIAENSSFLKKYDITNGRISFYKKSHEAYTKFKATIKYKYKILTENDKLISNYKLQGYITKNQHIYLKINDKANIKIADNIKISLHNSGISSEELLKFITLLTQYKKKNKETTTDIFFKAKDSYIYVGHERYIISDTINLQYYKGITTAQLSYAEGKAGFKLQNNQFHLYGYNFNDKFMDKLFSLSKFQGGNLDFSMSGNFDDYAGTFYLKDTTIQDYVLLNNILAFINTVPSLATFSLPGYNKNGLHIDNAYMKFHLKKHIFDISDIYIGSKELKILGKGEASVKYDTINLNLNLKTDLASNLSKIPLVGYIIFDGQSISTSLKITGKLTDPKVETMLARDIAVAPLNIILRTLTLPYKIVKDIRDYNSSK